MLIKVAPFIVQNNTQAVDRAIVEDLSPYGLENTELRKTMQSVFGDRLIQSSNGDLWQQDGYEIGYAQAPYGAMTIVLELPRSREYFFQPFENMRSFVRGKLLAAGVGVNTELGICLLKITQRLGEILRASRIRLLHPVILAI